MLCWGSSARGQLGLGDSEPAVFEPRSCRVFTGSGLRETACGGHHTLFLLHDGSVYTCGSNSRGQLGHEKPGSKPELVVALDAQKISGVACGQTHSLAMNEQGQVFAWGAGEGGQLGLGTTEEAVRVPRLIKKLCEHRIVQVMCGNQHCIALSKDGQLFTWGQNSSGQLGLGKGEPSSLSPQPLKSLSGIPLAQISAGGDHSFALSLSGAVFGWGRNGAGQLGLGDCEDRYIPTCVKNLMHKKTIFISCGEDHTATLSKGGTVFTFGLGRYGQLGHNSFRDELRPRVVGGLWGSKVIQIACGRHHTLALIGSSKTIYSFGCGEQGQLGNGQRTNQCMPLPVHLPVETNREHTIENIYAGGNHSFASLRESENSSANPEPNQRKGIVTLGERMIDRWLSENDSKNSRGQWKAIKKEIRTVFSSAACLNGSFIKKSCDGHYETSTKVSGLDLESVRTAFEQISKKEEVLLEVQKVVEKNLLPSLGSSTAGFEDLRVYLILPELLRVLNKRQTEMQLTVELASAILKLNTPMLTVLENYWSGLPDCFLKVLVELFRNVSAYFISQMTYGKQEKFSDMSLKMSLKVLQMIHKAASSRQRELTFRDFVIHEINDLFDMLRAVKADLDAINLWPIWFNNSSELYATKQYLEDTLYHLKSTPCIFNLEAKCNLLNFRPLLGLFRLVLRRTALLEDCFTQLRHASGEHLKYCLQVVYGEKMEISNVHKKDFFYNAFEMLREPSYGMFMYNGTKTVWFPAEPHLQEETYFLLGILCGLAFYNNSSIDVPFPLALFKKLLNIEPSVEDLAELDPCLTKSLQYIMSYSDEDVVNMDMIFTVTWDNKEVELDPNEPGKVVTSYNKKEFVDAYVDYILNKSVEKVFEEFRRGFYKVCDQDMVELFQPEELRGVMVGTEEYDWDTFKKNTSYEEPFHARHPTIISFWEVFDELPDKDKKTFLLFLTGFDRVHVLGMDQVKMLVRLKFNSTEEHLPEALTCHSILDLPMYQSKETLRTKFTEALCHRRGFWEE